MFSTNTQHFLDFQDISCAGISAGVQRNLSVFSDFMGDGANSF